jgi:hypothetical protein
MKTVVALYPRLREAEQAIRSLQAAGVARDRIKLIAAPEDENYTRYFETKHHYRFENGRLVDDEAESAMAEGGAAAAGVGNLLVGFGLLMIPAVGPVLAAGPLLAAVASGGAGAQAKDLVGILQDAGVPESEATSYADALRGGAAMLLLSSPEDEVDHVVSALYPNVP